MSKKEEVGLYLSVGDRVYKAIDRIEGVDCCKSCSFSGRGSGCGLQRTVYRTICTKIKLKWVEVGV